MDNVFSVGENWPEGISSRRLSPPVWIQRVKSSGRSVDHIETEVAGKKTIPAVFASDVPGKLIVVGRIMSLRGLARW